MFFFFRHSLTTLTLFRRTPESGSKTTIAPGQVQGDGKKYIKEGSFDLRIYTKKVDGDLEAHLIALSCSDPPQGQARWTLRLLADKAVELQYVDNISYETVRRVLKKTKSSLGNAKAG